MIGMPIEPAEIVQKVERYVTDQYADANKSVNRALLDEGGIYSLHLLAAEIYQAGFNAGVSAERTRTDGEIRRARERKRQEEA